MRFTLRVGVEWIEHYQHPSPGCFPAADLPNLGHGARSFLAAMVSFGHDEVFNWGNDNAWSSDFEHPDFGGDSLNKIDNVHFGYFFGHGNHMGFDGKRVQALGFSLNRSQPNFP